MLANGLAQRGHKVDLVVSLAEGPYLELVHESVNTIDLGIRKVILSAPALRRYFKENSPDKVLSTLIHANAICALALRFSGVRARLVLREASVPTPGGSLHNRLIYVAARFFYPHADLLIAVSEGIRQSIVPVLHLPESLPTVVIDNPLDPDMLKKSLLPIEQSIPGEHGASLVLAAGRLTAVKGFDTLIDAVAKLATERKLTLVILGEGPQRGALQAQIQASGMEKNIFLPGFVSNPFSWMRACDVFVLSSLSEGSPNIVIQAVACGAEVVASRITGCTDLLLGCDNVGRLVEPEDVEGFATAICAALDKPLVPDVDAWRERFSSERIFAEYENAIFGR